MMSPAQLKLGRKPAGLTQRQAAARLGVSQAYLALLEGGRRRITDKLARKLVRLYRLPPTALPMEQLSMGAACDSEVVARNLAGLGYPGFSFLRPARQVNPASVLVAALSSSDLEVRVVEALPWLVLKFPQMDWEWLLKEARQREMQNRLGFVVALARRLAARRQAECADRCWLREMRPPEARHWNLLTDLTAEGLPYAV